jgi:hypothetical protein
LDNKYSGIPEISLDDYNDYSECECGGPLFKYHDSTRNVFVVKCGYVKENLDMKTKTWSKSKKQPCSFVNIHKSDSPDYNNLVLPQRERVLPENPHENLRENLESLFKFYKLAKKDITIQEINSLVKFKLNRKTRITYYLVTAGPVLMESHRESMDDYYSRIFSRPIINIPYSRTTTIKNIPKKKNKSHFIETELNSDSGSEDTESEHSDSDYSESEDGSDTEIATECQINEEILDDLENLDLYDEPDEPDEYDYS